MKQTIISKIIGSKIAGLIEANLDDRQKMLSVISDFVGEVSSSVR